MRKLFLKLTIPALLLMSAGTGLRGYKCDDIDKRASACYKWARSNFFLNPARAALCGAREACCRATPGLCMGNWPHE